MNTTSKEITYDTMRRIVGSPFVDVQRQLNYVRTCPQAHADGRAMGDALSKKAGTR